MKKLLILILILSTGCHSKGYKYLDCNCIKSHQHEYPAIMYVGNDMYPTTETETICDLEKCDSVFVDSLGHKSIIKH